MQLYSWAYIHVGVEFLVQLTNPQMNPFEYDIQLYPKSMEISRQTPKYNPHATPRFFSGHCV